MNNLINPEIFLIALIAWTVTTCAMAYYFGYDCRKREEAAKELIEEIIPPSHKIGAPMKVGVACSKCGGFVGECGCNNWRVG